MDYLIDEKEFIEHESEIILSGCIKEFLVPKIYRDFGKIYWVYPDIENPSLNEYCSEDILYIKNLTKNYMLNPNRIIFHPERIFREDGMWKYHYIPSVRNMLYDSVDLMRYLVLEDHQKITEKSMENKSITQSVNTHILYNKSLGKIEKLTLKNTFIGGRKGKIAVDFDGEIKIDQQGNIVLLSGNAVINEKKMELKKNYKLKGGDRIYIDQTELIYWGNME